MQYPLSITSDAKFFFYKLISHKIAIFPKKKCFKMYIPPSNLMHDQAEMLVFMKRFSFAAIISCTDNIPVATHLPFLVEMRDDKIMLTSHFAKANNHWKNIENETVLVIFSEPHAYISTSHYDVELNVPTWNYLSIHAYGKVNLTTSYEQTINILERTIKTYEPSYISQWKGFPDAYKLKMAKGVVAFEMTVNDLQAKKKLSQNRTETEKNKIIDSFSKSDDTNKQLIADYMEMENKQSIKR
ncbi:transcriptional regulator [Pedobacter sp. UYP30]|uniref:FMN-binding negative transcriptional regulator n=1 Tax=Pedobacter sp. UYP30 TaxID=1756400 RepID=UPI003394CECF